MRTLRIAPIAALLFLLHTTAVAKEIATTAQLDGVVASYFKDDEPGAAILVLRDGKPLLRKGYGMADLELGVKIQPDHVFRIGSVTKQFTSVAILQLVEQGKIKLDDPITRFFPDYPTQGKTITVEHLLTHTSGIQSYTNKEGFVSTIRTDLTPQQLIDTFKNDPMQFSPGERYAYNNSAYVLLGALLEKVTGQSYADYVAANVFARAGLTQTYYGDPIRIIPKRIEGYDRSGGKVVNARYISMTLPYAAGSILSTVDDLAKWTEAVTTGKLVSLELLKRAWTPYKLTSGEATTYGYGWHVNELFGSRVIAHGGGIMGFSAHALWIPEEQVFVAVLSNTEEAPISTEYLARRLASYAIGKPWNPVAITMPGEQLRDYEGVYRIDDKTTRVMTVDKGRLFAQRTGGSRTEVFPTARDQFFYKNSFTTMTFERGADGKISAMTVTQDGKPVRAARTDEKIPQRAEIAIAPEKLDRYVGRYQLTPEIVITVLRKGNALSAKSSNSPGELQLYAESEAKWFAKDVAIEITFTFDASGTANGLSLLQGGRTRTGPRIPQ